MATKDVAGKEFFERCLKCGAELAPGNERCPACGTVIRFPRSRGFSDRRWLSWRNICRVLIAVLLIVVIDFYGPYLTRFLPLVGVLRFSPIVTEALYLAHEHQRVLEILGRPIKIDGFVEGHINDLGWYSGKSQLRIPVRGPRNRGTLSLYAANGQGPWIFTELILSTNGDERVNLLDHLPDQQPAMVQTSRRVYLIPLGNVEDLGLSELPLYYREKFGLVVELLAPVALDDKVRDFETGRLIAEEFEELMKRRLPRLFSDESAVLIGVTNEDMYIRELGPSSMYNFFVVRGRFGVVSSYLLRPRRAPLQEQLELVRTRVRKLISRNVGIMAFQLARISDPTSVLAIRIGPASNIDLVVESFEGLGPRAVVDEYRRARNETSYEPKLLPETTKQELVKAASRYPCLLMKKKPAVGSSPGGFDVLLDECVPKSFLNIDVDEIEIDLRSGRVMSRKTDFFIAGKFSVAATRCYGRWDLSPRAFGGNTSLSWDMYPLVKDHPYTELDLFLCDGSMIHYDRISEGSGYADALYEHRLTGSSFDKSQIAWTSNGWNLRTRDAMNMLFPATQNARRGVDGAMLEFSSSNGQRVGIQRDRRRNLKRIIAPDQSSINFEYDSRYRIIKSFDDTGKIIKYGYDTGGRLIEVRGPGLTQRFDYIEGDMTSVYENGHRLVEFHYQLGRLQSVLLADGRTYKIDYDRDPKDKTILLRTYLTLPGGNVRRFELKPN
jgi:YD repeat-containing protein